MDAQRAGLPSPAGLMGALTTETSHLQKGAYDHMYTHIYIYTYIIIIIIIYVCMWLYMIVYVWHISLMWDVLKLLTQQFPYHVSTISYHHQGMPCRWNPPCRTSKLRASPCRFRGPETGTCTLSLNFCCHGIGMLLFPILKSSAFRLSTHFRLWGWLRIWFLNKCSYWQPGILRFLKFETVSIRL